MRRFASPCTHEIESGLDRLYRVPDHDQILKPGNEPRRVHKERTAAEDVVFMTS